MKINLKEVVTLDFETYWAADFSLSSKVLNTSEYIRDPQFKVHCCSIKIGNNKTKVFPASKLKAEFTKIDWANSDLLCHHTAFDGAILNWHYGIIPRRYFDTVSMTRGLHAEMTRAGLDTIAKYYGIGAKSTTYLMPTKGLRELTPEIYKNLAEGCAIDTDLCFEVFKKQIEVYPEDEIALIDMTIRMFTDPILGIDIPRAERALEYEMNARLRAIALSRVDEKTLSSSVKFAQALRDAGIDPPMKWSAKQQCMAYAFAKTDMEFIELQDHDNLSVIRLAQGRLAAKSTIIETRAYRLIKAGSDGMRLPVMLNYFGAKTGRWSGGNKCLAGNTQIIVNREGEVLYIELSALLLSDTVWDGIEFVHHSGLIDQGEQRVMTYGSITATPDHEVWVENCPNKMRLDYAASTRRVLKTGRLPSRLETSKEGVPGS